MTRANSHLGGADPILVIAPRGRRHQIQVARPVGAELGALVPQRGPARGEHSRRAGIVPVGVVSLDGEGPRALAPLMERQIERHNILGGVEAVEDPARLVGEVVLAQPPR